MVYKNSIPSTISLVLTFCITSAMLGCKTYNGASSLAEVVKNPAECGAIAPSRVFLTDYPDNPEYVSFRGAADTSTLSQAKEILSDLGKSVDFSKPGTILGYTVYRQLFRQEGPSAHVFVIASDNKLYIVAKKNDAKAVAWTVNGLNVTDLYLDDLGQGFSAIVGDDKSKRLYVFINQLLTKDPGDFESVERFIAAVSVRVADLETLSTAMARRLVRGDDPVFSFMTRLGAGTTRESNSIGLFIGGPDKVESVAPEWTRGSATYRERYEGMRIDNGGIADWFFMTNRTSSNRRDFSHVTAADVFTTGDPRYIAYGRKNGVFGFIKCKSNVVSNDPKGCERAIEFVTEDGPDRIFWRDSFPEQLSGRKRIRAVAISGDTSVKIAFADGDGVHVLVRDEVTREYRIGKSIRTNQRIDFLRFLRRRSENPLDFNTDILMMSFRKDTKRIHKLMPTHKVFAPLVIGEHGQGQDTKHPIFQDLFKDLDKAIRVEGWRHPAEVFWQQRPENQRRAVFAAQFHPNCNSVITGGSDGKIYRWDIRSLANAAKPDWEGGTKVELGSHSSRVLKLEFASATSIMSVGQDNKVKIWNFDPDPRKPGSMDLELPVPERIQPAPNDRVGDTSFPGGEDNPMPEQGPQREPDPNPENEAPPSPGLRLEGETQPSASEQLVSAGLTRDNKHVVLSWKGKVPELYTLERRGDQPRGQKIGPVIGERRWGDITGPNKASVINFAAFPDPKLAPRIPENRQKWMIMSSDAGLTMAGKVIDRTEDDVVYFFQAPDRVQAAGAMTLSPKGQWIFSADAIGPLNRYYNSRITDLDAAATEDGSCRVKYYGHVAGVTGMEMIVLDTAKPDADKAETDGLLSVGIDGTLRIWRATKGCSAYGAQKIESQSEMTRSHYSLTSLSVSSDYNYAVTGTLEGKVLLWHVGKNIVLEEALEK